MYTSGSMGYIYGIKHTGYTVYIFKCLQVDTYIL